MNMISTAVRRSMLALSLLAISHMALAQFIWLDNKGVRQYSDRPPPPSTPRKNILKVPADIAPLAVTRLPATASTDNAPAVPGAPATNATNATDASGKSAKINAPGTTGAPSTPLTTAERNADYTKRKMDDAEKEKKAAEATKLAADKQANCDRAQSYSRSLADGSRIASTDKSGERSYLSDEQRAQELRNTQRTMAGCK